MYSQLVPCVDGARWSPGGLTVGTRGPYRRGKAPIVASVCLSLCAQLGATASGFQTIRKEPIGDQRSGPATDTPTYAIGPGDLLHISVWKEPEISRDVLVRVDGKISVPLLGDVETSGLTPQQLSTELSERLRRFVEVPHVTVSVAEANSTKFYVIGEVRKSGEFPLRSRVTVLQALAIAEGLGEFAKRDRILIIRRTKDGQKTFPFNYNLVVAGKALDQNVLLLPGDTIVVP